MDSISDKFCCFYMFIDEEDLDKSEKELEAFLKRGVKNKTVHRLKIKSRVASKDNRNLGMSEVSVNSNSDTVYLASMNERFEDDEVEEVKNSMRGNAGSWEEVKYREESDESFKTLTLGSLSNKMHAMEESKTSNSRMIDQVYLLVFGIFATLNYSLLVLILITFRYN